MEFKSLAIIFHEDHACRDPYYMGFTFDGTNFVIKGEFNKSETNLMCKDREMIWGERGGISTIKLANLLLEDCVGNKLSQDLASNLSDSLSIFPHGNGIAWILWKSDLKKWINFSIYGILPRAGYLSTLENEVLTIYFPVPGVSYNQVG